jgi:prevent-host-death family protein
MIRRISDLQAQEQFSELIDSVGGSNDRVIVERLGTPAVVLMSSEEYESLVQLEIERNWAIIQELRNENADVDPDQLMHDATEVVELVREEQYRASARVNSSND